jgi:hypothetical protein
MAAKRSVQAVQVDRRQADASEPILSHVLANVRIIEVVKETPTLPITGQATLTFPGVQKIGYP